MEENYARNTRRNDVVRDQDEGRQSWWTVIRLLFEQKIEITVEWIEDSDWKFYLEVEDLAKARTLAEVLTATPNVDVKATNYADLWKFTPEEEAWVEAELDRMWAI